jgi:hypothetical protein
VAQLGIAPRIAALRAAMVEPLASLAVDHPQRLAFGRLHVLSVAWLGLAMLGALAALVLVMKWGRTRAAATAEAEGRLR